MAVVDNFPALPIVISPNIPFKKRNLNECKLLFTHCRSSLLLLPLLFFSYMLYRFYFLCLPLSLLSLKAWTFNINLRRFLKLKSIFDLGFRSFYLGLNFYCRFGCYKCLLKLYFSLWEDTPKNFQWKTWFFCWKTWFNQPV